LCEKRFGQNQLKAERKATPGERKRELFKKKKEKETHRHQKKHGRRAAKWDAHPIAKGVIRQGKRPEGGTHSNDKAGGSTTSRENREQKLKCRMNRSLKRKTEDLISLGTNIVNDPGVKEPTTYIAGSTAGGLVFQTHLESGGV